jgi:hypothetical protein
MNGSYTIPVIIMPPNLNIGDSWAFDMAAGEYSSGGWIAVMTFASGTTRLAQDATLQQGTFYWLFASTDTATMPAGTLVYTVAVSNPTSLERYTIQQGTVQAVADISDPDTVVPTQTTLQQQLAACDATLLQLLSQRTSSVQFGGKAYTLWDIAKLWAVRNDLYQRVQDELAATSGNTRAKIIIPVFKNPWGGPYPSYPYYPYGGP